MLGLCKKSGAGRLWPVLLALALALAVCGCGADRSGGSAGTVAEGSLPQEGSIPAEGGGTTAPASSVSQALATPDASLQTLFGALQAADKTTLAACSGTIQSWGGFGLSDAAGHLTFSSMAYKDLSNDGNAAVVHVHGYMVYTDPASTYNTKYAINGNAELKQSGGAWTVTKLPEYLGPNYVGQVPALD